MVLADVTEYNLWVNCVQFTSENLTVKCGDGTATRENVFAGFTGSAEFAELCASYEMNA